MEHRYTKPYVVKPGDTMYSIAKYFNVPLDMLIAANPQVTNPDLIYPGQVIMIPTLDNANGKPCHNHRRMPKCGCQRPMNRVMPTPVDVSPYPCLPARNSRNCCGNHQPIMNPYHDPCQHTNWWRNPANQCDQWNMYPGMNYEWDEYWRNDWENN